MKKASVIKALGVFVVCMALIGVFVSCTGRNNDGDIKPNDNYRNRYEIFVYSFCDSDGDGIGDLNGVTSKLDYLKELGVNGIWLTPIFPSSSYHKYDTKDYYDVDNSFGTIYDFDRLISEAHRRDISVILDMAFNHTSSASPWFLSACEYIRNTNEIGGKYGEFYNFSATEKEGYCRVPSSNYFYEARFWSGMPDLNLDSIAVKSEIKKIMKFWLQERKVDGFRLDAVTSYFTNNVEKNVEFLSWLCNEARNIKSDCFIVAEAWEESDIKIAEYYKSNIDGCFLFTGAQRGGKIANAIKTENADEFSQWLSSLDSAYDGMLMPFLGNHDTMRPASFMSNERQTKMAFGLLSLMSGSIFMYYGEEIGLTSDGGESSDPQKRIAMLWDYDNNDGNCYSNSQGIGVSQSVYRFPPLNVQKTNSDSIYHYYKKALQLRNSNPAIARGKTTVLALDLPKYACAIRKQYGDKSVVIVINLSGTKTVAPLIERASLLGGLSAVSNATEYLPFIKDNQLYLPPYSYAICETK